MKLSGVIDALLAAGGSAEQIAAVVRAAEAEQEAIESGKRAKEAARKKAYREMVEAQKSPKVVPLSRDVPQCPADTLGQPRTDTDIPSPPPSLPPGPPNPPAPTPVDNPRLPSEAAPKGAIGSRGQALPDEWRPKDRHFGKAAEHGFDRPWVAGQADDMRIWATANRNRQVARKADWDATFDGWLRRSIANSGAARAGPLFRPAPQNPRLAASRQLAEYLDDRSH